MRQVLAAFTYRDYRVLWVGACSSLIGSSMQMVAQSWLVLTLTQSAFYLGLHAFLAGLPIALFTLVGGVVSDRYRRRDVVAASQYVQMACAFALTAVVATGTVHFWHVVSLSFVSATAQAFGGPAYQSLIPQLVTREHLPNAVALSLIMFNVASVLGPLLAGITVPTLGLAACFGLNGVSFVVFIVALAMLDVSAPAPPVRSGRRGLGAELRAGMAYLRADPSLMALIALAFLYAFLALPMLTLLPVFAQDVFRLNASGYSAMVTIVAIGSLLGALAMAWLGAFRHMGLTLYLGVAALGGLVVAFALSRTLWLSAGILFLSGATIPVVWTVITSLLQLTVPRDMHGRVMSVNIVAYRGGGPLGSGFAGYVASISTVSAALVLNGTLLATAALYLLARGHVTRRPGDGPGRR